MTKPWIKDGRRLPGSNAGKEFVTFLLIIFIGLPILCGFLVPVAIVSVVITQIGNLFTAPDKPTTNPLGEPSHGKPTLTSKDAREFDIVVFGATGFTGKMVAKHILTTYGNGKGKKDLKWAIAGRNAAKLAAVAADIGDASLSVVVADSGDVDGLNAMVRRTKVVVSTAGPFLLYGSELVRQCAQNGTHYADITGEIDWVRIMIDMHDEDARRTGARIVHMCGHDCVPWDLAVLGLADAFKKEGDALSEVNCYDEIQGSASGGTMATVFASLANRRKYKAKLGYDPLLKNKEGKKSESNTKPNVQLTLGYSSEHAGGSWVGFFVMSMVMANCTKRSNAYLNYSKMLKYTEAMVHPNFFNAANMTMSMWFLGCIVVSPLLTKLFLALKLIPSPGEGPTKEEMDKGWLKVTAYGYGQQGRAGKQLTAITYFPTDPGYRDTARMLAESGLLMALEDSKCLKEGGVHTPAAALGLPLMKRLEVGGTHFEVEETTK